MVLLLQDAIPPHVPSGFDYFHVLLTLESTSSTTVTCLRRRTTPHVHLPYVVSDYHVIDCCLDDHYPCIDQYLTADAIDISYSLLSGRDYEFDIAPAR